MKNAAAITGSLVDVRNVGTHKCVKLTIHVPAEYAPKVLECFGWPTGVDPVTVALARIDLSNVARPMSAPATREAGDSSTPASRPRKPVAADKRLAQQAGIACADRLFQKFAGVQSEEGAADFVRRECGVASRSEIKAGTPEGDEWSKLHGEFLIWRDIPALAPADEPPQADCQAEAV